MNWSTLTNRPERVRSRRSWRAVIQFYSLPHIQTDALPIVKVNNPRVRLRLSCSPACLRLSHQLSIVESQVITPFPGLGWELKVRPRLRRQPEQLTLRGRFRAESRGHP